MEERENGGMNTVRIEKYLDLDQLISHCGILILHGSHFRWIESKNTHVYSHLTYPRAFEILSLTLLFNLINIEASSRCVGIAVCKYSSTIRKPKCT